MPASSERFTSSAALQYYQLLPSLDELVTYIQQKICLTLDSDCQAKAASLAIANYLDVDYDSISHALVVKLFRYQPPALGTWNEKMIKTGASSKVEVGVLANEKAIEPEELSLGGFLTVIGKDTKPSTELIPFHTLYFHSPRLSFRSNPFLVSFTPSPIDARCWYSVSQFPSYSHRTPSLSQSQISISSYAASLSKLRPARLPHATIHLVSRQISALFPALSRVKKPPRSPFCHR